MPVPDLPAPSLPRLSAAAVLPAALLTVVALGLAWQLRSSREDNAALRGELTTLMLAQRAAASRESVARDALRRAARLEEALALMRRDLLPPAPSPLSDASQTVEFERVIAFLREEITAAHQTIERLKQDDAPEKPDKKSGRP